MADFLSTILNLGTAGAAAATDWVAIIINLVLSTVIGGVLLIVVLGLFNRIYGEMLNYKRAFIVVLIANIINIVGIMGFLLPYLSFIPYIALILPLLIWIVLLKIFFEDMSIIHAIIVGVVFFAITILVIPYLVAMAASYIPI